MRVEGPSIAWNAEGLAPAIVQDVQSGRVLMLAYMNAEALERTLMGEHVWFWSRSRQELWEKGATSGNYLAPRKVIADCDGDTLLVLAQPSGPVCHTGAPHCFSSPGQTAQTVEFAGESLNGEILDGLAEVIAQRNRDRPEGSYTARLLAEGIDRVAKKIGEEAAEVIIAGKNGVQDEITWEVADLWYHSLVLLEATGVPLSAVYRELAKRRK